MAQRLTLVLALLLAMTVGATPANAVTDGELDGNGHPYVGLMRALDADGKHLWRCSGTLISPRLFLTAGHCTELPVARVELFFDADVQSQMNGDIYPPSDATGTPRVHPRYDPSRFFIRDLGMVLLDAPRAGPYGALPTKDQLDSMKPGPRSSFTAVGYGLQQAFPSAAEWRDQALRIRMVAKPHLLQINVPGFTGDFSVLLSNNANTGGTCFGDSGGPNFIRNTNVIAGVTSYGLNGTCAGTGGVFRVDREWSLDWINSFGP